MNGRTGVEVNGPNCKARKALGSFPTVFQGKMYAILLCAQLNLNKGLKGAHINIMSDSQAPIKALLLSRVKVNLGMSRQTQTSG